MTDQPEGPDRPGPIGGDMAAIVFGLTRRMQLPALTQRHSSTFVLGLFSFVNGLIAIAAMAFVAFVTGEPFVFPSLGPTAFLLFYTPLLPASSPRNTLGGHAIGAAAGYFALVVFGLTDAAPALATSVTGARVGAAALSLGLTSGAGPLGAWRARDLAVEELIDRLLPEFEPPGRLGRLRTGSGPAPAGARRPDCPHRRAARCLPVRALEGLEEFMQPGVVPLEQCDIAVVDLGAAELGEHAALLPGGMIIEHVAEPLEQRPCLLAVAVANGTLQIAQQAQEHLVISRQRRDLRCERQSQ